MTPALCPKNSDGALPEHSCGFPWGRSMWSWNFSCSLCFLWLIKTSGFKIFHKQSISLWPYLFSNDYMLESSPLKGAWPVFRIPPISRCLCLLMILKIWKMPEVALPNIYPREWESESESLWLWILTMASDLCPSRLELPWLSRCAL